MYDGEPSTPKFNPTVSVRDPFLDPEAQERQTVPETPTKTGSIIVNSQDFLIVLTRLLKLKLAREQKSSTSQSALGAPEREVLKDYNLFDGQNSEFYEDFLYCHYLQSLIKREEFKIAVELFGYRQEELNPAISTQSLSILRTALEGMLGS